MLTITDYIDTAKKRLGVSSYEKVAKEIGITSGAMSQLRRGFWMPGDDLMIRIATVAGLDPDRALIDKRMWKAQTEASRTAWARIGAKIAGTAAALFLAVNLVPYSERPVNKGPDLASDIYIIRELDGCTAWRPGRGRRPPCRFEPPFEPPSKSPA